MVKYFPAVVSQCNFLRETKRLYILVDTICCVW